MRIPLVHWVQAAAVAGLLFTTSAANVAGAAEPGARYFDAGRAMLAQGDTVEGFKLVAMSVAMAPGDMARQAFFLTYLDRNAYNWNVPLHEALVAVAPSYPPLLQRLGKLYEGKQRNAEAEALYLKWAALRPDQAEPYARLGEHYYFTGEYQKGLAAFARHRELVGESDYALRRMAAIYHELGNHGEAERLEARARGLIAQPDVVALAEAGFFAR